MKVLITGAGGQLGRAVAGSARSGATTVVADHARLDIRDQAAVSGLVEAERPDWVINAAAYTAVDRAESEPELAHEVNSQGPANLATAVRRCGARLLHVSTDFVFGGVGAGPYAPDDEAAPLNVYGRSKREGEVRVLDMLEDQALVLRTSWLYDGGGRNFLTTMLRLMDEGRELRVVDDQIGTPTAVPGLARAIWDLIEGDAGGILHFADQGVASWYDFAVAIGEEAQSRGLLHALPTVHPVPSTEYPTAARRPRCSILYCHDTDRLLGKPRPHWRVALREVIQQ